LENVKTCEERYLDDLKEVQKIIVSTNPEYQIENTFMIAQSPKNVLEKFSTLGFKEVILRAWK